MLYINCKYSYMKSVISCKCDTVIITHFRRRFIVAKCNVRQPCYKYEVANLFPKLPEKRRCYLLYVAFFRRCINVVGFAKRNSSQNCSFFNFFFYFLYKQKLTSNSCITDFNKIRIWQLTQSLKKWFQDEH